MIKYFFEPISNKEATIFFLFFFFGEQSILLNQYYGHSRNNFWKFVYTIFETPFSDDYENKKALLLENNIALWDVLQVCERKGSLDSAIKNEVANDFEHFLKNHPKINHIFFNGQKAASFFKKYVSLEKEYPTTILPSTSPANAGKTFEEKLLDWKKILLK